MTTMAAEDQWPDFITEAAPTRCPLTGRQSCQHETIVRGGKLVATESCNPSWRILNWMAGGQYHACRQLYRAYLQRFYYAASVPLPNTILDSLISQKNHPAKCWLTDDALHCRQISQVIHRHLIVLLACHPTRIQWRTSSIIGKEERSRGRRGRFPLAFPCHVITFPSDAYPTCEFSITPSHRLCVSSFSIQSSIFVPFQSLFLS